MESVQIFQAFCLAMAVFLLFLMCGISCCWWVLPNLAYRKLKENGFSGPKPSFPIGNMNEMKKKMNRVVSSSSTLSISHDIHSVVFPYFSRWQKLHGKVFVYWLGTEAFINIADPEFLKKMSADIKGKNWGKPSVFKNDREPMFGSGLVMVEGDDWVRHRHVITPAFSPPNLKAMAGLMVESATDMLDRWSALINSGKPEIDFEKEIINTTGEIIAKTGFGISYESGQKVFGKLRKLQIILFKSNKYEGVPFSKFMNLKKTLKARNLGNEIDSLLVSIITDRLESSKGHPQNDLLGLLLSKKDVVGHPGTTLTTRELVDECKTFFFGGHETTALALTWTLLLLATNPEWQIQLREEIREVIGDGEIDATMVAGLKKMGWVMNEVLRLYPPAPNVQRQARQDIKVDNNYIIPRSTNIWIDVVSMHHDQDFWGENVNEFKPERFKDDPLYGGCKHKMGFLPFGFGGRMCVARNFATMEYKIVLTLILTRFSLSLSPLYCHCPAILLSLRPAGGLPLIFEPL